MAMIETSRDERQIAMQNRQKLNRRVPLFGRGVTVPIIVGTALLGLTSYAVHVYEPGIQACGATQ
jgi:hypothetical protein